MTRSRLGRIPTRKDQSLRSRGTLSWFRIPLLVIIGWCGPRPAIKRSAWSVRQLIGQRCEALVSPKALLAVGCSLKCQSSSGCLPISSCPVSGMKDFPENFRSRCLPAAIRCPAHALCLPGFLSSVERRVCELAARSGVLPRARRSGKRALCGTIRVKRSQRSTSTRARQPFAKQASIKD